VTARQTEPDDLDRLLADASVVVREDGFSDGVMNRLPQKAPARAPRRRDWVIGAFTAASAAVATAGAVVTNLVDIDLVTTLQQQPQTAAVVLVVVATALWGAVSAASEA
jgi:hypothetical protein